MWSLTPPVIQYTLYTVLIVSIVFAAFWMGGQR